MNQNEMIQSLRTEIAKLQRVLDLLLDQPKSPAGERRAGRPKAANKQLSSLTLEALTPKKRSMSAEGKARIVAAQKKRWAAQKGSAEGATAGKPGRQATRANKSPAKSANSASFAGKKGPGKGKTSAAKKIPAKRSLKTASKRTTNVASKSPTKQAAGAGSVSI